MPSTRKTWSTSSSSILRGNLGHQIVITAGMDHARGDAVVVIDSDLQDPPEVIPNLIAKWREGYEVVYAVRAEREGETWFKLFTARLFYRIIQALTDVVIPMEAGDFRLLDRNALEALKQMRERHRFVRAMVSWIGFRQIGVPYKRHARTAGETNYPFKKMFPRLALDAITGRRSPAQTGGLRALQPPATDQAQTRNCLNCSFQHEPHTQHATSGHHHPYSKIEPERPMAARLKYKWQEKQQRRRDQEENITRESIHPRYIPGIPVKPHHGQHRSQRQCDHKRAPEGRTLGDFHCREQNRHAD